VNRDILRLEADPRPPGVERIVGPGKNYRTIYQIRDQVLLVLVVKVGDRTDVYRGVER
jgi:hypothetical protein